MIRRRVILLLLVSSIWMQTPARSESISGNKTIVERVEKLEKNYDARNDDLKQRVIDGFNRSSDSANRLVSIVGLVATVYGIIIALASLYVGYISIVNKRRKDEALATLDGAKRYVEEKLLMLDQTIEAKLLDISGRQNDLIQLTVEQLSQDVAAISGKAKEEAAKIGKYVKEIEDNEIVAKTKEQLERLDRKIKIIDELGISNDPKFLYSKAMVLKKKGELQLTSELLEKVISISPNDVQALFELGLVNFELNNFSKSVACYDKAIEHVKDSSILYNNKGFSLHSMGKFKEAIDEYDKAIAIDIASGDNYSVALNNKVSALFKIYDTEKAISIANEYIKSPFNKSHVLGMIARSLVELGDFERATEYWTRYEKSWKELIDSGDKSESNLLNYFESLMINCDLDEAKAFVSQLPQFTLHSHQIVCNMLLAFLFFQCNQHRDAVARLKTALNIKEDNDGEVVWTFADLLHAVKPSIKTKEYSILELSSKAIADSIPVADVKDLVREYEVSLTK